MVPEVLFSRTNQTALHERADFELLCWWRGANDKIYHCKSWNTSKVSCKCNCKRAHNTYVTQGPKTRCLSFLAFLLNYILHCISFKILFTESKYLVSNWSYTRLIRTIKKVKKNWIKCLRFPCHRNPLQSSLHYSENIPGNKGLHSVSNKTNRISTFQIMTNSTYTSISTFQIMTNSRTPAELKNW